MKTLLNPKTWAMALAALTPTGVYYLVTFTILGGERHVLLKFVATAVQFVFAILWARYVMEGIENE
jgi:hypothetical protein